MSFLTQSINTVLSVFKVLVRSKKNIRLPGATVNRCIVLANGPSLNSSLQKSPEAFALAPLICVNTFAMTPQFAELQPEYYVMLDPYFWEQENETTRATFSALTEKTSWPMYLLIPQTAVSQHILQKLAAANPNIKLTVFNYTVFKGFPGAAHWFYKRNLAMMQSLNVTITAIFLGINMGFKEVVLVGADHTWHENLHMSEENILHTKVTHFYEDDEKIEYRPFHKSGDSKNPTQKAHEFFDIWSRTFYAYHQLREYADYRQVKIGNASEVSFIDAFQRIKI